MILFFLAFFQKTKNIYKNLIYKQLKLRFEQFKKQ